MKYSLEYLKIIWRILEVDKVKYQRVKFNILSKAKSLKFNITAVSISSVTLLPTSSFSKLHV